MSQVVHICLVVEFAFYVCSDLANSRNLALASFFEVRDAVSLDMESERDGRQKEHDLSESL